MKGSLEFLIPYIDRVYILVISVMTTLMVICVSIKMIIDKKSNKTEKTNNITREAFDENNK